MSATLSDLQNQIGQLSRPEQMTLLERLSRQLHQSTAAEKLALQNDLAAMAADPQIQEEIRAIEEEFRHTEMDGLEAE